MKKVVRTEIEVLYDFEKLGFEILENNDCCLMKNVYDEKVLVINKLSKHIRCYRQFLNHCQTTINNTKLATQSFEVQVPCSLSIVELKVLYELFEIWGWL